MDERDAVAGLLPIPELMGSFDLPVCDFNARLIPSLA